MCQTRKIVLLGDVKCGKSSLMGRYTSNTFTKDYVPTVFDYGSVDITERNNDVTLNIWDTPGSSEFDHVRSLCFNDAVLFIICFDLNNEDSLRNVRNKWLPEIKTNHKKEPIILCGCKSDARQKHPTASIQTVQGMAVAKQIGASAYIETSSLKDEDRVKIETLFNSAASIATGRSMKIPKEMRVSGGKEKYKRCCVQ